MKTVDQLLKEIEALGSPGTARVLKNHGAKDPVWGAKIGDMKPLIKGIKSDPRLAQGLFDSGVYDAMYLAALVVHGGDLDEATLDRWARLGYGSGISASTVPWVAVEHPRAVDLALGWIESPVEAVAVTGWSTLGGLASTRPDTDLDLVLFQGLLDRAATGVTTASPELRAALISFVVQVAVYVEPLREPGMARARILDDAALIPIGKALARGPVKKKKTMKC